VGVSISGAFVKTFILMLGNMVRPSVAASFGKFDLTRVNLALGKVPVGIAPALAEPKEAGVPALAHGKLVSVAISFYLLGPHHFLMIKQLSRHKLREPTASPVATPKHVVLLREIRDRLRK